jgi:hypothetical protein
VSETKAERWNEKIDTFIERITNSIPAGEYRDRARQRLDGRLQNTEKEDEFSAIWRKAANGGRPDGFDQSVDDVWREIACSADGAPYVLSSLIGRLGNLADKDRAARLAKDFQAETCQGRKGLSADDLASLKKISARAPPQKAGQPQR